jgi:predicted RNA binding protein YcfA (HicA-like mRNA interferase family)
VILRKETAQGSLGCVVPLHRELAIGTLRGILQQANVLAEEFIEKL